MTNENEGAKIKKKSIPEPSLRRLPWYLSYVKLLVSQDQKLVSSTQISHGVGVDAALVAKDLSHVNLNGRTRVGYRTKEIVNTLEEFLGFTSTHKAFVVGVGRLGSALMQDKGLRQFGLEIEAGFDIDESLAGTTVSDLNVYPLEEISDYISENDIRIAVLTVPTQEAQTMTDLLVESGVKAIWNFTPFRISVPNGIVVQNTSLYAHLALMYTRLRDMASE